MHDIRGIHMTVLKATQYFKVFFKPFFKNQPLVELAIIIIIGSNFSFQLEKYCGSGQLHMLKKLFIKIKTKENPYGSWTWWLIQAVGEEVSMGWNERLSAELVFYFIQKEWESICSIRVKNSTFLVFPHVQMYILEVNVTALYIYHCFLCLPPRSLMHQGNKSLNSKNEDFSLIWHKHANIRVFSRASLSHRGARRTDDQKQMAPSPVEERRTHSESVPNTRASSVVFSKADISKRTPTGNFLDVKTLTNSRSSHLLLYSFLPRCYCETLAVKFNWFKIFCIHMATNPGAEAARAPRCCSQVFASPLVPRWRE